MLKNYAVVCCDYFNCTEFQAVTVDLNIVDGKIETEIDAFPKSWEQNEKKAYCPSHKSRRPSEYK
jgi:hypothetical protein